MATRGVSMTITYVAWDTANNAPRTGDESNHTLRWIKDGTASAPTNSPSEVDSTNCPGVYKLQLTSMETDCDIGTLSGKSSSSGVVLIPVTIQFERLPNAAPGQTGGLPIIGSSPLTNLDASVSSRLASNDSRLNYLDAAISSRLSSTDSRLNHLDAAISSRASAADYTSARAAKLDNLDATVSSRLASTDSRLDYLDAAVSSRLATANYTPPDNTGIAAIKTQTDKLQFTTGDNYVKARSEEVADKTGYSLTGAYDRAKNALAVSEYTAPDNASISAIKSQTDKFQFTTENYVKAKSETVADKTGYSLTSDYDRAKTALAVSEYTTPDNTSIGAIKVQTDKLQFTSSNYVKTRSEEVADKTGYTLTSVYDRAKTALAVSEYTAPDNASISAIKAKTDKLQFTNDNDVIATLDGEKVTVQINEDKTGYSLTSAYDAAKTAANQTTVDAVQAKTDKLTFNESNAVYAYGPGGGASAEEVWSYSDRTLTDKTGFSLTSNYDRAKTALSVSEYVAPDNTSIAGIKTKTDKLQFTGDNLVLASVENLGTGMYSVTLIVKNRNNEPLPRAYVRLRLAGLLYQGWTTDQGQIRFLLDAGMYTVLVQKFGYESYSGALEVSDDMEQDIILNVLTIPESDPGFITVYSYCYTKDGDPEPNVEIECQVVYVPGYGKIMSPSVRSSLSNAVGLVVFDNLIPGARYKFKRSTAMEWIPITIPPTAISPYELISFVS